MIYYDEKNNKQWYRYNNNNNRNCIRIIKYKSTTTYIFSHSIHAFLTTTNMREINIRSDLIMEKYILVFILGMYARDFCVKQVQSNRKLRDIIEILKSK